MNSAISSLYQLKTENREDIMQKNIKAENVSERDLNGSPAADGCRAGIPLQPVSARFAIAVIV
jgi:hypothetical protein